MLNSKRPVRVLILTSIRDVGACDLNGCTIQTRNGPRYMMGVVEHMVRECRPSGMLGGLCELAGVVTDDTDKDLARCEYPTVSTSERQWIHPLDLQDHRKRKITGITERVPSSFRTLPKDDIKGRCVAKEAFEMSVHQVMKDADADVLLLDHYMAKIEFLISEKRGLYGRVINIHPAVTVSGHPFCFRGKTPTADAIAHACRNVETKTGATLHIVNDKFDDGPIIHWDAPTPVYADDTAPELRQRNYDMAKLPVFVAGMSKYLNEMYPRL